MPDRVTDAEIDEVLRLDRDPLMSAHREMTYRTAAPRMATALREAYALLGEAAPMLRACNGWHMGDEPDKIAVRIDALLGGTNA